MHDDCLIHEALLNTFKRLGTDKPHKPAPIKEEQEGGDGPKRPLSPSESGAAQTAQQSIDVKPEEKQTTIKLADVEKNGGGGGGGSGAAGGGTGAVKAEDSMTVAVASSGTTESKKRGRPRKSEPNDPGTAKPYEGLFEAIIKNDVSPPVFEIKDLRENVTGGEKEWTESINCLACKQQIH